MTAWTGNEDTARVAPAEACVFRALLERRAAAAPDRAFACFDDGETWTYGAFRARVVAAAHALRRLGVRQDDFVLSWQPNGREALASWLAINYLGAVYVPLNVAYRGRLLEHAVHLSGAWLMIAHPALAPRLADIDTGPLKTLVTTGGDRAADVRVPGLDVCAGAVLRAPAPDAPPPLARAIAPWDTQMVLFTSGTTGPSKGVLCSYFQQHESARACAHGLGSDDRALLYLPLFHVSGTAMVAWALAAGASLAVLPSFDTRTFWASVRRTGATYAVLMAVIPTFLLKLPRGEDEIETPLRRVLIAPVTDDATALCARAGLESFSVFNMTEISCPLVAEADTMTNGTCGRPRPGVEARVVDEHDIEVPPGATGELIVRTAAPWAMNHGYHANPEATARAWRNGWFHTGDAFRRTEDGEFFFVDRMKDAIRRRGENISSFEVEAEATTFPAVREAAAVAVPSEAGDGEDEVLLAVAPVAGERVDPAALTAWLAGRMAYFMVPRYVRILDDLPKTPTQKVRKTELRAAGLAPDTWDREAAGIRIRRERLAP